MSINDLPEKLRVEGVQLVDRSKKEKRVIRLSESQMTELERIVTPILDREQQGA